MAIKILYIILKAYEMNTQVGTVVDYEIRNESCDRIKL